MMTESNKTVINSGNLGSPGSVKQGSPISGNGNGKDKQPLSHLHIKKDMGNGVQINVFGDTPAEAVTLMCATIALCEGFDQERPIDAARAEDAHTDRVGQETQAAAVVKEMTCANCGSARMKHITWNDKKTGEARANFKCEDCNTWLKKSK